MRLHDLNLFLWIYHFHMLIIIHTFFYIQLFSNQRGYQSNQISKKRSSCDNPPKHGWAFSQIKFGGQDQQKRWSIYLKNILLPIFSIKINNRVNIWGKTRSLFWIRKMCLETAIPLRFQRDSVIPNPSHQITFCIYLDESNDIF